MKRYKFQTVVNFCIILLVSVFMLGSVKKLFGSGRAVVFFPLIITGGGAMMGSIGEDREVGVFEQICMSKFSLLRILLARALVSIIPVLPLSFLLVALSKENFALFFLAFPLAFLNISGLGLLVSALVLYHKRIGGLYEIIIFSLMALLFLQNNLGNNFKWIICFFLPLAASIELFNHFSLLALCLSVLNAVGFLVLGSEVFNRLYIKALTDGKLQSY